jgi:ferritin-like metal-binding protein YciE
MAKTVRQSRSKAPEKQHDELGDLQAGFIAELGDMLHAEKQLTKALPKMARAALSPQLREALQSHLEQTEEQIVRLEEVFEILGLKTRTEPCEGMKGILAEGNEILRKTSAGPTRDALIIAAAQKAEHYEIASYGSLCAWGQELGQHRAVELLEQTLEEEKAADQKLTRIAESKSNVQAREQARQRPKAARRSTWSTAD